MTTKYFGVSLRQPEDQLKLRRDNYLCKKKDGQYYFKDSWLKNAPERWPEREQQCLQNFDLNMLFFRSLSHEQFSETVESLQSCYSLREIHDLNAVDGCAGIYVMVLDNYCQLYVGKTSAPGGIKQRVMAHWNKKMYFDRLIMGSVNNSPISIDSFKALDTSRVFVFITKDERRMDRIERHILRDIPCEFCSNRTEGGNMKGGLMEACAKAKFRNLD